MVETILVLQPIGAELRAIIEAEAGGAYRVLVAESTEAGHQREMMGEADYVVFWDEGLPGALLEAGGRLKLAHKWGVGVENIDLEVARRRGIRVARTTGGNAVPVAEFAVGLMLAAGRRIVQAHNSLVGGQWAKNEIWRQSVMLSGKTVGIVGMGAIGSEVAKRVRGFGCRVVYTNRRRVGAEAEAALGAGFRPLGALLEEADFVCLTCPLTAETRGMIGAAELGAMRRGAILVNVARGGIVVEEALVAALRSGQLAAAAVDVFEPEPPRGDNPLLHLPNVVVTPHCASTAFENSAKGVRHWLRNIGLVAGGGEVPEVDRVG